MLKPSAVWGLGRYLASQYWMIHQGTSYYITELLVCSCEHPEVIRSLSQSTLILIADFICIVVFHKARHSNYERILRAATSGEETFSYHLGGKSQLLNHKQASSLVYRE